MACRRRFDNTAGTVELDESTGSIHIKIDASSISTGNETFNQIMRSADFFDTANYPKINFKSSSLRFEDQQLKQANGNLTIKGITRPVTLDISHFNCRFMLIYGKRACGANGSTKILCSDCAHRSLRTFCQRWRGVAYQRRVN